MGRGGWIWAGRMDSVLGYLQTRALSGPTLRPYTGLIARLASLVAYRFYYIHLHLGFFLLLKQSMYTLSVSVPLFPPAYTPSSASPLPHARRAVFPCFRISTVAVYRIMCMSYIPGGFHYWTSLIRKRPVFCQSKHHDQNNSTMI